MPINPYYKPVSFNYKPLGVDKFIAPFAAMQQQYDTALGQLEESEFNTEFLNWAGISDPEKAKSLIKDYEDKVSSISEDLIKNKNYRRAVSKLNKLNKNWTKDPERLAIANNYAKWNKIVEDVKEKYEGRPDYVDYVLGVAKSNFIKSGGTEFFPGEGADKYNVIQEQQLFEDLSEEWEKAKLEAAKITPEQVSTFFQNLGVDEQTGKVIQEKITQTSKEKGQIAGEVEKYMRSLERFKPWLDQEAKIDLFFAKQNPESYNQKTDRLLQAAAKQVDKEYETALAEEAKKAKKEGKSPEEYPIHKQYRQLKGQFTGEDSNLTYGENAAQVEEMRDQLYVMQKQNNMYDAEAVADLIDFSKITRSRQYIGISDGKKPGGSGDDLFEGFFTELDYQNVQLDDLVYNAKQDWKGLYEVTPNLFNNVSGLRELTMGADGTQTRRNNEEEYANNPAKAWARTQAIMNAYSYINTKYKNKSAEEKKVLFRKRLWNQGIKTNSQKESDKAFNGLSNTDQNTVSYIYEQGNRIFDMGQDKIRVAEEIKTRAEESENFDTYANDLTINTTNNAYSYGVGADQSDWDKAEELGLVIRSGKYYTSLGGEIIRLEGGTNHMPLDIYAKIKGFNSVGELLKSKEYQNIPVKQTAGLPADEGFTIKNVRSAVTTQILNEGEVPTNTMTYRYTNNEAVDNVLKKQFNSSSDLLSFKPAYERSFSDYEGLFDDEGNMLEGTEFDYSNGQTPKLVKFGTSAVIEVPVKNTKTGQKTLLYLQPKKGFKGSGQYTTLLNHMEQISRGDNATHEMVNTMRFDNIYPSTIDQIAFDITEIPEAGSTSAVNVRIPGSNKTIPGAELGAIALHPSVPGVQVRFIKINTPVGDRVVIVDNYDRIQEGTGQYENISKAKDVIMEYRGALNQYFLENQK